jgi:preprotein translocase SecE subunit
MWKIYKEGQGKWARVCLVTALALGGVFAVVSLHNSLPARDEITLPVLKWSFDYRFLFAAPVLIAVVAFAVWLFNHPGTADFLIDTESELKNKVTWPSKEKEINASLVVVVTVILMGLLVLGVDTGFQLLQKIIYQQSGIMQ